MTATPVDPISGTLDITPPRRYGPWPGYECRVCVKGTATCLPTLSCPANGDPTTCAAPNLDPSTGYEISCEGVTAGGTRTPASSPADLVTPQAP